MKERRQKGWWRNGRWSDQELRYLDVLKQDFEDGTCSGVGMWGGAGFLGWPCRLFVVPRTFAFQGFVNILILHFPIFFP